MRIYKGNIRTLLQENLSQETLKKLSSWEKLYTARFGTAEFNLEELERHEAELQVRAVEVAASIFHECHDVFMSSAYTTTKAQLCLCNYIYMVRTNKRKTFYCRVGNTFYLYNGEYLHEIYEDKDNVYTLTNLPEYITEGMFIYYNLPENIKNDGSEYYRAWRMIKVMNFLEKGVRIADNYIPTFTLINTIYNLIDWNNVELED